MGKILIVLLILVVLFMPYWLWHFNRVYNYRLRTIAEDYEAGLPREKWRAERVPYEYMRWRFWVLDLDKFFDKPGFNEFELRLLDKFQPDKDKFQLNKEECARIHRKIHKRHAHLRKWKW